MENYLNETQLLLDFLMKGDNWLPLLLLFFAAIGILESIENIISAVFSRKPKNNKES